jgi:hypothetical protein
LFEKYQERERDPLPTRSSPSLIRHPDDRPVLEQGTPDRMRGAVTVPVGIQPEVALAMVELGISTEDLDTALDLDEGLELLRLGIAVGSADG